MLDNVFEELVPFAIILDIIRADIIILCTGSSSLTTAGTSATATSSGYFRMYIYSFIKKLINAFSGSDFDIRFGLIMYGNQKAEVDCQR